MGEIFSQISCIFTSPLCKACSEPKNVTIALTEIDIWSLEMSKVFKVQMSNSLQGRTKLMLPKWPLYYELVQMEEICGKMFHIF